MNRMCVCADEHVSSFIYERFATSSMMATSMLVQVRCIMTSASNFFTISSQIENVASAVEPPAPFNEF